MDGTLAFFGQVGLNSFWAWVVAIVETLGGALVLLGAFVSYASVLLGLVVLFAIILVKWKFTPGFDAGPFGDVLLGKFAASEIELSLLGSTIALAIAGAGRFSLMRWCKCHKAGGECKVCDAAGCEHETHKA
jgi:uncharacterized membrane protein YphA (DoxX/SURF4 family)